MSQTDSAAAPASAAAPPGDADTAALAKGGRTNFFGFILRLVARLPFLYVAGRWYGPEAVGRFAFAVLVIELIAQLATLGLKRGLAEQLSAPGALNCSASPRLSPSVASCATSSMTSTAKAKRPTASGPYQRPAT